MFLSCFLFANPLKITVMNKFLFYSPFLLSLALPLQAQVANTLTAVQTIAPPAEVKPIKPDSIQTLRDEIAKLTVEKDRITAEIAVAQARLEKDLSESKMNVQRFQAQLAELKARQDLNDFQQKVAQDKELAEMKKQMERVALQNNILKSETEIESLEIRRMDNAVKRETAKLAGPMELGQKQAESRTYATAEPSYLKEPLQGKKLIISDRRISLNGPISMTTADQITSRINYFNNRDKEMPIFVVIDDCPGGSVMAGYKILKAMQGSSAPIHVVVKSFAASMAACITTMAAKSYAYPNAVILHHQIAAISGGNLTQQQEWVKEMEEWWKRLATPIADKMGITREEFIKRMYAHSSSGDWNEFGDNAQKLKWVDTIVDEIEETSTIRHPDTLQASTTSTPPLRLPMPGTADQSLREEVDEKGRAHMNLPRLNPLDCYWIYNPDGYFRTP